MLWTVGFQTDHAVIVMKISDINNNRMCVVYVDAVVACHDHVVGSSDCTVSASDIPVMTFI